MSQEIHGKAFLIAVLHYVLSAIVAYWGYAIAFGSALSDAPHEPSGLGFLELFLLILQAPLFLASWLVKHYHDKTQLGAETLFLLGIPSSVLYGYAIALVFFRGRPQPRLKPSLPDLDT